MKWFRTSRKQPGWLALSLTRQSLSFAHGCQTANGRPAITCFGMADLAEGGSPEKIARELRVERYHCAALLRPGDYQVLAVEAPAVAKDEMKSAIRWRIKDLLDYRAEDATVDVLDIPPETEAPGRSHSAYAVAARSEIIRDCAKAYHDAQIPLSVIDIPETAQRNLSALHEPEGRGVALLYLHDQYGLLTITFRQELYLARRIEIGLSQILRGSTEARTDLFARIMLELQRSFDHFDRQFNFVPLAKLLLAPEPEETGLHEYLKANMDLPVEPVRLLECLGFPPGSLPDRMSQWHLFHLFGAALRQESRVH